MNTPSKVNLPSDPNMAPSAEIMAQAARLAAALNPAADPMLAEANAEPRVPALKVLTPQMEQHAAEKAAYFLCSIKNASMHRRDGKRLPFINGVMKVTIVEDIEYLRSEIKAGNQYIKEASSTEVDAIEQILDPRGTMERQLRAKIESEVRAKVMAEMAATGRHVTVITDESKIAGVDAGKVTAPDNVEVQVVPLKPVSSTDIASGAAGNTSSSALASAAAAALAGRGKK